MTKAKCLERGIPYWTEVLFDTRCACCGEVIQAGDCVKFHPETGKTVCPLCDCVETTHGGQLALNI